MEDWRRIDIDALEPDKFLTKQDLIPNIPSSISEQDIPQIVADAKSKLSKGQFLESLQLAIGNPPYLLLEQAKNTYTELMFEILISIKNNNGDVTPFIKQLNDEEQDNLVKYLYKIMSTNYGAKQGGILLVWFEKTIEITGLGPVIRFMSDRRTV